MLEAELQSSDTNKDKILVEQDVASIELRGKNNTVIRMTRDSVQNDNKAIEDSSPHTIKVEFLDNDGHHIIMELEWRDENKRYHLKNVQEMRNGKLEGVTTENITAMFQENECLKNMAPALKHSTTLSNILFREKIITKEQYEQIMPKNTIEEDNNKFKEENTTIPKYDLWCLPNSFVGKDKSTGKWGCFGIDCC